MTVTEIERGDTTNLSRDLTDYMHNKIWNEFWMHEPKVSNRILLQKNLCIEGINYNIIR